MTIQDPTINWNALEPTSGANFIAKRLVATTNQRLEFLPTKSLIIFGGLFFIVGLAPLLKVIFCESNFDDRILMVIASSVFILGAAVIFWDGYLPIVFDRDSNLFWIESNLLWFVHRRPPSKSFTIDSIRVLQLLRKYISGSIDTQGYYCFELNIVHKNDKRTHIVTYGNINAIRADSKVLAEFLDVPIIDGIGVS